MDQSIILLVVMFAALYFFMIRPENKRKKQAQAMRDGLKKGDVIVLNEDNFDAVVNGKRNVMVKFYAPWCGHCRALAPIYIELAKTVEKDDVVIAELDADKYKELAVRERGRCEM